MENLTNSRYISESMSIFKCLGFIKFNRPILEVFRKVYFYITFSCLNIGTFLLFLLYAILDAGYEDFQSFLMYFMLMAAVIQCCVKLTNCVFSIKKFQNLNELIRKCSSYFIHNPEGSAIIQANAKITSKIYRITRIFFAILIFLYCLQPFISSERTLMYEFYVPPFIKWQERAIDFWLITIYQICMSLYFTHANLNSEVLCSCYLYNVCGYLNAIKNEITHLNKLRGRYDYHMMEEDYKRFQFIMKVYEEVLR